MEIVMNQGEIICIDGDARELEVTCYSGTLWITQVGDPNDYLLSAGESFTISQKGRVAVTACKTANANFSASVLLKHQPQPWQVKFNTARVQGLAAL